MRAKSGYALSGKSLRLNPRYYRRGTLLSK